MSKIGRKPINVTGVEVAVNGQQVQYKGPKASGVYSVPEHFEIIAKNNTVALVPRTTKAKGLKPRDINREWGMHRALLANELTGAVKEFERIVEIVGLGYKAVKTGEKVVFTLGYSHKIDFPIPKGVAVSVDSKTGQRLTLTSSDKQQLGQVCRQMCRLRPIEPYKGTGVKVSTDQVLRKESKGK
jgi:large subunit ribosomal protein L6